MAKIMVNGEEVEETPEQERERERHARPNAPTPRGRDGGDTVTAFQIRAELAAMRGGRQTMLQVVEGAMDGGGLVPEIALAWRHAPTVPRNSKLAQAIGAAIGAGPAQLDTLFREAAKREV
jgi:hypothetical protein